MRRLLLAASALLASILAGCAGSAHFGGMYMATGRDGTVIILDLIQRQSNLTGKGRVMAPVTADQAQSSQAQIYDQHENLVTGNPLNGPVLGPAGEIPGSNTYAACGGTPVCLAAQSGTLDGQVGSDGRMAVTLRYSTLPTTWQTLTGAASGSYFKLEGLRFKPTTHQAIVDAIHTAFVDLRVHDMPAGEIHNYVQMFQPSNNVYHSQLQADLSNLHLDTGFDPMNSLGCGYADTVEAHFDHYYSDLNKLQDEVNHAQNAITTLQPVARSLAGDDVQTLRSEVTTEQQYLAQARNQEKQYQTRILALLPRANGFLARAECGAAEQLAHAILEGG